MLIKRTSEETLNAALDKINNEHYQGNVRFKDFRLAHKRKDGTKDYRLTLRVFDYDRPGYRTTIDGRKANRAASWHAHGHFFDALFELDPNVQIVSGSQLLTKPSDNWQDIQVGSAMNPAYMSQLSAE